MKNVKNKAVIYTRTASADQKNTSVSIQKQVDTCLDYAKQNNFEVQKIYTDIGVSGLHILDRPSIKELLGYINSNKDLSSVIVYSFDRLSRNVEEGLATKALLSRKGINLLSASESTEFPTAEKFLKSVLAACADLDKEIKIQRVKDSMKAGFMAGNWMWRAPFGYKRDKNKNLIVEPEQAKLVKELFGHAIFGYCISTIEGIVQPYKDLYPTKSEIIKIISNPFYKGMMRSSFSSELVRGKHEQLVTDKEWAKANKNLNI